MSEETKTQQPENTTQPEDNGAPAGKTFTQDEVNKIISERLTRERSKAEPDPSELRDKELTARENTLTCKEFLSEKGYPAALLDILDTTSSDVFKQKVEKLLEAFPALDPKVGGKTPIATGSTMRSGSAGFDPIAEAFKRKDG